MRRIVAGGVDRARTEEREVLVSEVREVSATDPLIWLQQQQDDCATYWRTRHGQREFASLGSTCRIARHGSRALVSVCDEVGRLLRSWRDDVTGSPPFAPRFFGGFSFESAGMSPWVEKGFDDAVMILPRVLCIREADRSFLQVNVLVTPDSDPAVVSAGIERLFRESAPTPEAGGFLPLPVVLGFGDDRMTAQWVQMVDRALQMMAQGELEKVVLARSLPLSTAGVLPVWTVMARLRAVAPECFQLALGLSPGSHFVGSTPEQLFRLDGSSLETDCIAGTIGRGTDSDADQSLADVLLDSDKDRLEHFYVMEDILRSLGDLCDHLDADTTPRVLRLSTLQHLITSARGHLRPGFDVGDILKRLHPTPAVGGAPREQALATIRKLEPESRGWYAGPVGWVAPGEAEFAVAIRSAMLTGSSATVFAGAGIVPGSTPEKEWRETENKARAFLKALQED